ncbi:MAG: Dihydrofolate reductase [Parcubacteria group bacterium GW2011_GWA1_47_8]|nr:MAG: Dihydrofolate reductase [Parcubacteria group bacterium GW2011_GWA1_47_8]KKW07967.1 MAG: Dihydrofolate reductase [Parcubacteria group bacterium GW2011_GWA2_49_16]
MLSLIVAMDKNHLIGDSKKIPWHLPADFAYFKETTMGHPIIMGRATFESIGRPLPGRKNIVLTRGDFSYEGVLVAYSFDEARVLAGDIDEVFVIGGAQVYTQALPVADRLHVTFVEGEFTGNTFFPKVDWSLWREVKSEKREADEHNLYAMRYAIFERI